VILFYSGGFGGADAKAFMCLALALPFYPAGLFTPVLGEVSPISRIFFPIAVFSNSVLFAALTAVAILLYNMLERVRTGKTLFEGEQGKESIGKKILILITGYKVSVNVLKAKWHVYPLEDIEEEADDKIKRKLIVLPKDEGRDQIVERLQRAADTGKIQNRVWASPGLPMLVFVTAGLIAALFLGDLIWTLVRLVLG
jgi:preflagellin peptidase FlaK